MDIAAASVARLDRLTPLSLVEYMRLPSRLGRLVRHVPTCWLITPAQQQSWRQDGNLGQAGREGFTTASTGSTALYRDGELVGESDLAGIGVFDVPPEPADYRLAVTAEQDPRLELSTSISAEWTFRSEHVEGGGKGGKGEAVAEALSMVRFMPRVDEHNALRAGRGHVVPVEVYGQAGAPAQIDELTVAASTDDGKTWQPARTVLLRSGLGLVIMPPGDPGYVSLRASGSGPAGTVEVTVVRAYRLVD